MANELTLTSFQGEINKLKSNNWDGALPAHISAEYFTRCVLSYVKSVPKILECDRLSIFSAFFSAAQLGLIPEKALGQAYIIPFGKEATFIPGYRGLLSLAYRNPSVKDVYAEIICERDEFSLERGDNPRIFHRISLGNRGGKIGAYAVCRFMNGGIVSRVFSADEILTSKKRSKSPGGCWTTDEDEMWMKTAIRKIAKWLPMCTELQTAVEYEESIDRGEKVKLKDGTIAIIPEEDETDKLNNRFKNDKSKAKQPETTQSVEPEANGKQPSPAEINKEFWELVQVNLDVFLEEFKQKNITVVEEMGAVSDLIADHLEPAGGVTPSALKSIKVSPAGFALHVAESLAGKKGK